MMRQSTTIRPAYLVESSCHRRLTRYPRATKHRARIAFSSRPVYQLCARSSSIVITLVLDRINMRACIQRVREANVVVNDEFVGQIGRGLLVLLGVSLDDGDSETHWLAEKTVRLRIFEDEEGRMNRSLEDVGGELLVVSQFTLYGDCRKGRRPSFVRAAPPEQAERLYEAFITHARRMGVPTASGQFRAQMQVHLVNEGPVTIWIDTAEANIAGN